MLGFIVYLGIYLLSYLYLVREGQKKHLPVGAVYDPCMGLCDCYVTLPMLGCTC